LVKPLVVTASLSAHPPTRTVKLIRIYLEIDMVFESLNTIVNAVEDQARAAWM
jgi:hypothetical protein